jgi:hypothetical protein
MTLPWILLLFLIFSPIIIPLLGLLFLLLRILFSIFGFLLMVLGVLLFFIPAFIVFALFRGLLLVINKFGWLGIILIVAVAWLLNLI